MPPIGQCTGCRRWLPLSTSRFSPLPHSGCYRPPLTHYLIGYYRCGWVASGGVWFWRLVLERNCRLDGLDPVITRDVSTAIQLVLVFAGAATAPSSRATLSLLSSLCSHFKIIIFNFLIFFLSLTGTTRFLLSHRISRSCCVLLAARVAVGLEHSLPDDGAATVSGPTKDMLTGMSGGAIATE